MLTPSHSFLLSNHSHVRQSTNMVSIQGYKVKIKKKVENLHRTRLKLTTEEPYFTLLGEKFSKDINHVKEVQIQKTESSLNKEGYTTLNYILNILFV